MHRKKASTRLRKMSFGAWPLTYKLIIVFLLTSLLPLALLSYLSLHSSLNQVELDQKEHLELNAHNLSVQIDHLLNQHHTFAQSLAKDPDIVRFLENPNQLNVKEQVDNDLDLLTHSLPHIDYVSLIGLDGLVLTASLPQLMDFDAGFRDYFQTAIQGNSHVTGVTEGTTTHQKGIFFSAPVFNASQHVIGVVVIKLNLEAVDEIFIKGSFQDYVLIPFLIDQHEQIIYHPNPDYRYQHLRDLPSLQTHYNLSFERSQSIEFTLNSRLFVAGVAPIHYQDWSVFVAEPYQNFAAPIHALFYKNGFFLLFCGLGSIALAWLFSRSFIRPLNVLMEQAKQIKEGHRLAPEHNTDLDLVTQRNDELGHFAKVFQAMITEVYHREFVLDTLVQQRTHELTEKNRLLADFYARIDQELQLAHDMQQAILPHEFPHKEQFQIYANMRPAREVGGDFYDCFELSDGRYAVLVADVSGKGIASAFFMGVSSTILKQAVATYQAPDHVLRFANQLLNERNPASLFVTVFYGVFDPKTTEFSYACAGHPPALLRHADGSVSPLPVAYDLPLGAWDEVNYHCFSRQLAPSDMLFIYSDGITEAMSETQEEFGETRLIQWLTEHGKHRSTQDLFATLKQQLHRFVGQAEPNDDMTVLLLRLQNQRPPIHQASWTLAPDLTDFARLVPQIEDFLTPLIQRSPQIVFDISLCLDELINNIIKHGEPADQSLIELSLTIYEDHVCCQIQDQGLAFNPFTHNETPDLQAELSQRHIGGMGIHLIKRLMDEYSYSRHDSYNCIRLYKHLAPPQGDL